MSSSFNRRAETIVLSIWLPHVGFPCMPSQALPSTSGLFVKYVHGRDLRWLRALYDPI